MKDAQRQGVIIAAALLVLIGLGTAIGDYSKKYAAPTSSPSLSFKTEKTVSYKGQTGKTVLELLRQNHTVETQDSEGGTIVTSIDGVAQKSSGSDSPTAGSTAIWLPYINGQPASESVDKTQTQDGQTIEWRLVSF